MNSNKIGVLGLGNRSTLFYINALNERYNQIYKGFSTFPFILYNSNFNEINPFLPNDFVNLEGVLLRHLNEIKRLGIDFLTIPNITLHETFDRLKFGMLVSHPVKLTIEKLIDNNEKEAVIFGSLYTMQSEHLKSSFEQEGIALFEPSIIDKEFVDQIRQDVYLGLESSSQMNEFNNLIRSYANERPVIIGCTELSIMLLENPINIYDMASLQIENTLNYYQKTIND